MTGITTKTWIFLKFAPWAIVVYSPNNRLRKLATPPFGRTNRYSGVADRQTHTVGKFCDQRLEYTHSKTANAKYLKRHTLAQTLFCSGGSKYAFAKPWNNTLFLGGLLAPRRESRHELRHTQYNQEIRKKPFKKSLRQGGKKCWELIGIPIKPRRRKKKHRHTMTGALN